MKHTAWRLLRLAAVASLIAALAGCTTKATSDTTSDGMTNFFSSTTGKSWFTEDGLVKHEQRVNAFASINFENVKKDMARGNGEYLEALGVLLEIPGEQRQEFYSLARDKYPVLFPAARTTPDEMLTALAQEMSQLPIP